MYVAYSDRSVYGNDVYPHSRRLYSRFYACYFNHPAEKKEHAEFLDALHLIGKDLLGYPFNICLDHTAEHRHYFSPAFWLSRTVAEYSMTAGYQFYKQTLPPVAQDALGVIVDQMTQCGGHLKFVQNAKTQDYDLALLDKAFPVLWEHDIFLDPRVTEAEELFMCDADKKAGDVGRSYHEDGSDVKRLDDTLAWMQKDENAKRVGLMFLYSRIAQHTSETDPRAFALTLKIAAAIDGGESIADVLSAQAASRALIKTPVAQKTALAVLEEQAAQSQPKGLVARGVTAIKDMFVRTKPEVETKASETKAKMEEPLPMKNMGALKETFPRIVQDYKRLCDGSWASEKRIDAVKGLKVGAQNVPLRPAEISQQAMKLEA